MIMLDSNNPSGICTLPRHCEECLDGFRKAKPVQGLLVGDERRSNLPSLIDWREFFNRWKITSLQSQSQKIASQMQQRFALFAFLLPLRRLAMTTKCSEATTEKGGA
jgi:hypothetical protein